MLIKKLDQAGSLLTLDETNKIKTGLVILQPGEEIGYHVTDNREEVILVLEGEAVVELEGENEQVVKKDHLVYIPTNKEHNVRNKSDRLLRYIYLVSLNL